MYHLCLCLWWGIARMKIIAVYELECAKRTEMLLIWMVFWLPNKMGWKIFGALIFFFFFEQYCDHTINEPSWPSGISVKCLDFPLFAGRAYRWWSFVVWHPPYKAPSSITFRSLTTAVHPQPHNPQAGRQKLPPPSAGGEYSWQESLAVWPGTSLGLNEGVRALNLLPRKTSFTRRGV